MRLTIPADLLARACAAAKTAMPSGDPKILLTAREGRLSITGADGQLQITWDIECQVAQEGACAVNGTDMANTVRSFPKTVDAILTLENGQLGLSGGRAHFELPVMDANDFPGVDTNHLAQHTQMINGPSFGKALEATLVAVATEEAMAPLKGVHLLPVGDTLRLAATDGHRLVLRRLALGDIELPETGVILPLRAAREIARLCNGSPLVSVAATDYGLLVQGGAETILTRLIDADYPDIERIIGQGGEQIVLEKNALQEACARVRQILDRTPIVRFQTTPEGMSITAERENRKARDFIPGTMPADVLVGLNAQYVLDALKGFSGPRVVMIVEGPLNPVRFKEPQEGEQMEQPSALALVMPARV